MKLLIKAVICIGLFYSCTSEQNIDNPENESANQLITNLKSIAQEDYEELSFVRFDLSIDEMENISLTNEQQISKSRHADALLNVKNLGAVLTMRLTGDSKSTIVVCCDDGSGEVECETCPDGAGQSLCILRAIDKCTNSGGCAVVCENKMYYNPVKDEFFIIRK